MMVAMLMVDFSRIGLARSGDVRGDVDVRIDDDDVDVSTGDDDVGRFQHGPVRLSMMVVNVYDSTGTSKLVRHR